MEDPTLERARAMRRAVLGDACVDSQTADPDPATQEFQHFLTSMAWGTWARAAR